MKLFFIATLTALLTGCATQTYIVSEQETSSAAQYNKSQHFFVSKINTNEICGEIRVGKVQTTQTLLEGIASNISYGVYSPRTMRVFCKQ